ncbi:hypothetical protein CLM62_16780 [Streptomyces sp. SA15]|uniref:hypothetical protein n=1 Tax=Streptomyces sp. SA15 TaxID=934019 RepID=UPI000BAFF977|nr:hypothetical protein [Streptomyces sp. SA15]PAZ14873.1 hypothetical protein CLM62_16780 [Streptomyces sp. SA15]
MTLKYTDLVDVDLGKLGTAVSDWKKAVTDLKTLAEDARRGLLAKSESARWAGVNATVTREFVKKTTKEFADLHSEGNSVFQVLDDAQQELAELQRKVRTLVAEAEKKRYVITDNGDTTVTVVEYVGPGEPPKDGAQEEAQRYADQITASLGRANDIDQSVKLALTRAHGNDPNNAGHNTYESLNDAQAERAVELAKKGDKMSDQELAELNRIMKFNGREEDGEFATEFYEGLGGPEKALEFYGQVSTSGTEKEAGQTRLDAVRELQKNMGYTLANATEPDAPHGVDKKYHLPASWGAEFRRLGTQQIEWQQGMMKKPYGYQILGGILRYGNYDPSFINPIAEHITQLHQQDPGKLLTHVGSGEGENYGFNPSGKLGSGEDPMNSVLEALGHSPDASEKFFTDAPTAYNEDGTVNSKGKVEFKSYLDLFTDEDFLWNADSNNAYLYGDEDKLEAARNIGPQALGHALESATTGRPYDSDDSGDAVRHTAERANLASEIVKKFGENPELIRHNENGKLEGGSGPLYAMRESLGDITAEYMGDFQTTLAGTNNDRFGTFGVSAQLDPTTAERFLAEVGQDPHAYAAITSAQQAYTANVVNDVMNGHSDSTVPAAEQLRNATRPGGIIAGIMSESRADAVLDYHSASDQEFNDAAAEKQKWVDRLLGMGVDKAAERVPILGAPIGWASEDIQESIMKSIERDTSDQAEGDATRTYLKGREAVMDSARTAVEAAARNGNYNWDTVQDLQDSASNGADDGHTTGAKMESSGDGS